MSLNATASELSAVDRPPTAQGNVHYVGNRSPLAPAPLLPLPIGAVRPAGWLQRMLRLQGDGFHGHLTEISQFLKKENNAWLSPVGRGERGWEEVPYWLKGFQDCAYLLNDARMLGEARIWIEGAINSQQADGWFGPGEGRTGLATDLTGREDLWPNMIMLFCLQSYYDQTKDERVLVLMRNYYRYLQTVPEGKFLVGYWPQMRAGDLLHSLFWFYNRTGESQLLELAHRVHRHAARWDTGIIDRHNVNLAQGFREPAIYSLLSLDPKHARASQSVWEGLRAVYGQVPGGMYGADENCRPGYIGPRQAIESCGIVEEMLSDELMLGITGDLRWADQCENVAFNSLPAAMTSDFKALRYLTAPNQPQSDHVSKAPGIQNGGDMYQMNPHSHRCCQHNIGHGWPYFAQHLWYASPDNGLAAILYAPGTVKAKAGDGAEVTITESTRYPFEETITLQIQTDRPARFPLYLRVPGWCARPSLSINRQRANLTAGPRQYVRIDREWRSGDVVSVEFPATTTFRTWRWGTNSTTSVERGPLTYSVRIKERYARHGGTERWPAWDILPESPWNYGLVLPQSPKVVRTAWPKDDQPFEATRAPVQLKVKARRVPQWQLDEKGLIREVQATPVRTQAPQETITLIPMGAARLRLTAFPLTGRGPDAHEWTEPPKPAVTASHCNDGDSVTAAIDEKSPQSSGDLSIPRFTWWDHRGTTEWIQREFNSPRTVGRVEVYWFDDTGVGQCRVPESCRVVYRRGGQWCPVAGPGSCGVQKDVFNATTFEPVSTDALRLEVQLQEGYSGGILEWKIGP